MNIKAIVACSENQVIGREGDLPWKLSADLKHFKKTTSGHHIIMGRKTFDSLRRPLPNRTNIVLTRNKDISFPEGVHRFSNLEDALAFSKSEEQENIFIIGGSQIYQLAWPHIKTLHITLVHTNIEGDAFFPKPDIDQWTLISSEHHEKDERNEYDYSFQVWERKGEEI